MNIDEIINEVALMEVGGFVNWYFSVTASLKTEKIFGVFTNKSRSSGAKMIF